MFESHEDDKTVKVKKLSSRKKKKENDLNIPRELFRKSLLVYMVEKSQILKKRKKQALILLLSANYHRAAILRGMLNILLTHKATALEAIFTSTF